MLGNRRKGMALFRNFVQRFADTFTEFLHYAQNECCVCGQKVNKDDRMYSLASFNVIHKECFEKLEVKVIEYGEP